MNMINVPEFDPRPFKRQWWEENRDKVAAAVNELKQKRREERRKIFEPLPKDTRLVYLRLEGKPVGCLVTKLVDWPDGGKQMEFQYSACNPEDKYNKEVGRALALMRLATSPFVISGDSSTTPAQFKYAATEILEGTSFKPGAIQTVWVPKEVVSERVRLACAEWLAMKDQQIADSSVHAGVPLN